MFWERYVALCAQLDKGTPNKTAKLIGVSNATCTKWKNGAIPNGETLMKIARHFDCSVDYLLCRTDQPQLLTFDQQKEEQADGCTVLSPQQQALIDLYDELDPLKQAKLIVYADELKKSS